MAFGVEETCGHFVGLSGKVTFSWGIRGRFFSAWGLWDELCYYTAMGVVGGAGQVLTMHELS